ncbi:MAG TPA: thioredoxin domain-containing protein, partial [Pyrinomonadaceae bacterium]
NGPQFTANTNTNSAPTGASPYAPLGSTSPGAEPPHVRGPASAPVTLEEFGDYQCPPCGALFRELQKVESEYGDKLRFIFRHYPITERHKNALVAAHAAEAAGLQNKYWEMHDRLYDKQLEWAESDDARTIFINYARDLKLDAERFTRDMDAPQLDARIAADRQRAQSLGVIGTPTLFVNGRQLKAEAMTPELIRKAIDYMLSQKQQ